MTTLKLSRLGRTMATLMLLALLVPVATTVPAAHASRAAARHLSQKMRDDLGALLQVSPSTITAGQGITVSGAGFQPGEPIRAQLMTTDNPPASLDLAAGTAGGDGSFSGSNLTIPASVPAGSYVIVVVGLASGLVAQAPLSIVEKTAEVTATPTQLGPNDAISVAGSGFMPGEVVSIDLSTEAGSASVPMGAARADQSGSFIAPALHLPYGAPAGQVLVVVTGQTSNVQSATVVTVRARQPVLSTSRTTASPGDAIDVSGSNFAPNEAISVDLVTLSGSIPLAQSQSDAAGSFSLPQITLPTTAPSGSMNIVATGTASHLSAESTIAISAAPAAIQASTYTPKPGDSLRLTGHGFTPGETLTFQLAGGTLSVLTLANAIADASGAYDMQLTIPGVVPAGTYALAVSGLSSERTTAETLTVRAPRLRGPRLGIVPTGQAAPNTYQANPGALVQVAGSSFAAGSQVTLVLSPTGTNTQAPGQAGTQTGTTRAGFAVPAGKVSSPSVPLAIVSANSAGGIGPVGVTLPATLASGSYSVQALVAGTTVAAATLRVHTIRPLVTISRHTVAPGVALHVQGSHFAPGEQVVLAFNGTMLSTQPSTILASHSGGFSVQVAAPPTLVNGDNVLSASGATSRSIATVHVQARIPVASQWYLANGNTTAGYRTVISLVNPGNAAAHVHMTFLYSAAPARTYYKVVPAHAHAAVDLALAAGAGRHVSTILQVDRRIGAESTVYFGRHAVATTLGAAAPARSWYLAEGYTGQTFHESLQIMNPNSGYATADVRFVPFNGQPPRNVRFVIAPRATILIDAGHYMPRKSISTVITADKGIVVERTMRFGRDSGGVHDSIGSTLPATVWMFAQGQSDPMRQTFLTILNPGQASPAAVTASFFDSTGRPLGTKTIVVDPLRRGNVKLNDVLAQAQVATIITSNVPVVVERAQYLSPPNLSDAISGSVMLGRNGGSSTWLFAGASTAPGDHSRIYLFNPDLAKAQVMATFYSDNGRTAHQSLTVPANGYAVLDVSGVRGLGTGEVGAVLQGANGRIFVAEQADYNSARQSISANQGIN